MNQAQHDLIDQVLLDIRTHVRSGRSHGLRPDYYEVFVPVVRELKENGLTAKEIAGISQRVIESCVGRRGSTTSANKASEKFQNLQVLIQDAWDDAIAKCFGRELKIEDIPADERLGAHDAPINLQPSGAGGARDIAIELETALIRIKGTIPEMFFPDRSPAENRRHQIGLGRRKLRQIWDVLTEQQKRECEQFLPPTKKTK